MRTFDEILFESKDDIEEKNIKDVAKFIGVSTPSEFESGAIKWAYNKIQDEYI